MRLLLIVTLFLVCILPIQAMTFQQLLREQEQIQSHQQVHDKMMSEIASLTERVHALEQQQQQQQQQVMIETEAENEADNEADTQVDVDADVDADIDTDINTETKTQYVSCVGRTQGSCSSYKWAEACNAHYGWVQMKRDWRRVICTWNGAACYASTNYNGMCY